MAYRRAVSPSELLESDELTAAMVGIGMNFAAEPTSQTNIEDTLLAASEEGMERDDLRVLSVLTTWLGIHHAWINADRLHRAVQCQESLRVRAFWSAIGKWLQKDRRLARLSAVYDGPRVDLLRVGTRFQLRRRGEDPRFADGSLRVAGGVLRDRATDVLSPTELARRHRGYWYRILIGPSYRADMWAALDAEPSLSPAELARQAYGSFATAWQVKQDWLRLDLGTDSPRQVVSQRYPIMLHPDE